MKFGIRLLALDLGLSLCSSLTRAGENDPDVLVIGGGPAGLITAIQLVLRLENQSPKILVPINRIAEIEEDSQIPKL